MDNDKKLFEGLLKADGIDPAGISESERAAFKKMLDSEQKHMNRLAWRTNTTLWIFVLAMLGLCLYEKIFEALRVPFVVGCLVIMVATLIVMFRYMPEHNRKLRESGRKIQKLHYLIHGRHKGLLLIGKKDGKRHIFWLRIIMIAAGLWLAMSLGGAGVFYLLCGRWVYSSDPVLYIIYCALPCLSLVIFVLRDGLKTPLDELVEVKQKPSKPGIAGPDIWRIILKSKMIKFAVAVIVVAAIFFGIDIFNIQPDGASIAFAEMIEAMKQESWIYRYLDNGDNISEWWVCLEGDIEIDKYNGEVTYTDINERKTYIYKPEKNTISIEYTTNLRSGLSLNDPKAVEDALNRPQYFLNRLQLGIENLGEKATISQGVYRDRKVQIQAYGKKEGSETEPRLTLYIDPETKLLIGYTIWASCGTGPDPKNLRDIRLDKIEMAFDFPNPGPQSIYDVGVPRDAEVINRIDMDFIGVWEKYENYRNKATEKQIAVSVSTIKPDRSKKMLEKLGWPWLRRTGTIIEDDYSKENGLVGVEYFQVTDPTGSEDRITSYLNPEKGYVCQKRIIAWADGTFWVNEVTKYQNVDGLWYPSTVTVHTNDSENEPLRFNRIYTISLGN
ncbi:MAG: hypothetical protein FVQ79_07105 [Planctomycetes bacterium]|nr:hypothetical protein [Planctomycetota bacterium]